MVTGVFRPLFNTVRVFVPQINRGVAANQPGGLGGIPNAISVLGAITQLNLFERFVLGGSFTSERWT